jgi:hypothetical protein
MTGNLEGGGRGRKVIVDRKKLPTEKNCQHGGSWCKKCFKVPFFHVLENLPTFK